MDSALLSHLLQLAARTGDRLIVVDPTSQQPFVLMGLAQYERLVTHAPSAVAETPVSAVPTVAPAAAVPDDAVVRAANDALTAWRAEQGIPTPAAPVAAMVGVGGIGFAPEPLEAVPTEERFYIEPLE